MALSARAQAVNRRTYNRPLNDEATIFETWEQTTDRVIGHQRWLWERVGTPDEAELSELRDIIINHRGGPSGRTFWLGGTETGKTREASQFNCAHLRIDTVHDLVDALWLLLQGCGVGFYPVVGTLNGFTNVIPEVEVIRSTRTSKGGDEGNTETFKDGVWTIRVGDSGEAWAKALGKLFAGKFPARKLVFDLSQIRPGGSRLKGYGWISSGDEQLALALPRLAAIMNNRATQLLTKMDIHDILNWFGVIQTGRRGAEISLMTYGDKEWFDFAMSKKDYFIDNPQREQSNNSLIFWKKPSFAELRGVMDIMVQAGGSEPGLINGEEALRRAPWFKGVNPCGEILLGNKGFCNLVEIDVASYTDFDELRRAVYIAARANYRQTCVNLDDGILQRSWHENNEYLRLCGTGLTGIARRSDLTPTDYRELRDAAQAGADSMADHLGLPRSKAVTTIKPGGTRSKAMDTTEGCHKPAGRYIFNNIKFSKHDPMVAKFKAANYNVFADPVGTDAVIVTFPVEWPDVEFSEDGYNMESAITQLERYKMLMDNYVDHNCSITISYDREEVPGIAAWLHKNWDSYVGVSFVFRTDPTVRAEDLGYPYLPQEVVTHDEWLEYSAKLLPVDLDNVGGDYQLEVDECEGGMCPVR